LIVGQGYGWSLLADHLSILSQDTSDSQLLISQSSSENSEPAPSRNAVVDIHSDHQEIAVAKIVPVRSAASNQPNDNLVDNLAGNFANDGFGLAPAAAHRNAVSLPAIQSASAHPPTATPVATGFLESPLGVTTPAQAAPASTHGLVPTGGQAAQRTALPDAQPLGHATVTSVAASLHALPNLQVTINHYATDQIRSAASQPNWATYLGGAGDDRVLGLALSQAPGAAQPVIATGFTQKDDPTEYFGFLASVSTDGTAATVATLGFGTGTRTEGHRVDVDAAGNAYVIGQTGQTSDPTTNADLIVRVDPAGNLTWAVGFTPTGSTGVGNALKLDATGTNLYVTGGIDGNLLVAELTNLNAAMPTVTYANTFAFAQGPAVGTGIGPDSFGDADIGFTLTASGTTDNRPGFGQIAPDGTFPNPLAFNSVGAKSGTFGLTVDSSDNFFLTGGIFSTADNVELLVIAEYDVNVTRQYAFTYGPFQDASGKLVDVIGRDIQVDLGDNAFVAVVRDGGPLNTAGGVGTFMKLYEVDPGGNQIDNQQVAHGSGEDQARALALDTTNSVLYMAGFTSSTNFNFTAGEFQPAYGGGPYDGVLVQEQLS
jgi:hypothetical protein